MQFGLFTEFEWMAGHSAQEAFCTSLAQVDEAERLGCDSVWLGEIHVQKGRSVATPRASSLNFYQMLRADLYRLCKGTIPPEYEGRLQRYDTITDDELYEQQALYGTPEEVIAKIRWLQAEIGCNNLLGWMNAGSRLTQEQVLRSMRRFAAEVMPAFHHN